MNDDIARGDSWKRGRYFLTYDDIMAGCFSHLIGKTVKFTVIRGQLMFGIPDLVAVRKTILRDIILREGAIKHFPKNHPDRVGHIRALAHADQELALVNDKIQREQL